MSLIDGLTGTLTLLLLWKCQGVTEDAKTELLIKSPIRKHMQ